MGFNLRILTYALLVLVVLTLLLSVRAWWPAWDSIGPGWGKGFPLRRGSFLDGITFFREAAARSVRMASVPESAGLLPCRFSGLRSPATRLLS